VQLVGVTLQQLPELSGVTLDVVRLVAGVQDGRQVLLDRRQLPISDSETSKAKTQVQILNSETSKLKTEPDQTEPDQTEPDQTEPDQTAPNPNQTPSRFFIHLFLLVEFFRGIFLGSGTDIMIFKIFSQKIN
jgi:hypothetical protein